MSSMRDAGIALVLLLLAMTVRVDQPAASSVVPAVQAASEAAMPAVATGTRIESEFRVIRLEAPAGLDPSTLPTIVFDPAGNGKELRFVVVGAGAEPLPAPLAVPATLG